MNGIFITFKKKMHVWLLQCFGNKNILCKYAKEHFDQEVPNTYASIEVILKINEKNSLKLFR